MGESFLFYYVQFIYMLFANSRYHKLCMVAYMLLSLYPFWAYKQITYNW